MIKQVLNSSIFNPLTSKSVLRMKVLYPTVCFFAMLLKSKMLPSVFHQFLFWITWFMLSTQINTSVCFLRAGSIFKPEPFSFYVGGLLAPLIVLNMECKKALINDHFSIIWWFHFQTSNPQGSMYVCLYCLVDRFIGVYDCKHSFFKNAPSHGQGRGFYVWGQSPLTNMHGQSFD